MNAIRYVLAAALMLGACEERAQAHHAPEPAQAHKRAEEPIKEARAREAVRLAVISRIEAGADPAAEALAAARKGQFGLISTGEGMSNRYYVRGVVCHTPNGGAETLTHLGIGDAIDDRLMRQMDYAAAYNRAVVSHPAYPDADLCVLEVKGEADLRPSWSRTGTAARPPGRPPRDMWEAARFGTADEMRRLLDPARIDERDGARMRPIEWAAARGNRPAFEVLLKAGAMAYDDGGHEDALVWAARFARRDIFFIMAPADTAMPWQSYHLAAARDGGDAAIVERIMASSERNAERAEALKASAGTVRDAKP